MKSLPLLLLLALTFSNGSEALSQVLVPGINAPQNSFGDRVTQCLLQGSLTGLTGGDLSAYAGECASQ